MASISRQSKEMQERHRRIMAEMMKQPDNLECQDCRARNPSWASINLGIFVCIRCSGLHRQVGVHISKVRSTTMDLWEPDQIAYMQRMGNARARQIYEAKLPKDYGKPSEHEDSELVLKWIRTKYEHKKYMASPEEINRIMAEANEKKEKPKKPRGGNRSESQSPASPSTESPASGFLAPGPGVAGGAFSSFMSPLGSPRKQDSPQPPPGGEAQSSAFGFIAGASGSSLPSSAQHSPTNAQPASPNVSPAPGSAFGFMGGVGALPTHPQSPVADDGAPVVAQRKKKKNSITPADAMPAPQAEPNAPPPTQPPQAPQQSAFGFMQGGAPPPPAQSTQPPQHTAMGDMIDFGTPDAPHATSNGSGGVDPFIDALLSTTPPKPVAPPAPAPSAGGGSSFGFMN